MTEYFTFLWAAGITVIVLASTVMVFVAFYKLFCALRDERESRRLMKEAEEKLRRML